MLAETLRPELDKPGSEIAQGIGVRHQDADRFSVSRVRKPLKHREYAGWISIELWCGAFISHLRRTGEKLRQIDADERRRQSSDWSQNAEAATDTWRNVQRGNLSLPSERSQCALRGISDEHEMIRGREPSPGYAVVNNHVLRHRLRRAA